MNRQDWNRRGVWRGSVDGLSEDQKALQERCCRETRRWYDFLGLTQWGVQVLVRPRAELEGCTAHIHWDQMTLTATVSFSDGLPEEDLDWVALHEMLHLVLAHPSDLLDGLAKALADTAQQEEALQGPYQLAENAAVEQLTRAIMRLARGPVAA
jgi:hypothetical protein